MTDERITTTMIEETDRSWLAIAHRAWSNEHIFGSIHFLCACDVMVATESAYNEQKNLGVKLISEGKNDLPPLDAPIIKLSFDDWGLHSMEHSSEEEFPELASEQKDARTRIIKLLLDSNLCSPVSTTVSSQFFRWHIGISNSYHQYHPFKPCL